MYGSGSLRQTGSLPILSATTAETHYHRENKEEPQNSLAREDDNRVKHHGRSQEHHDIDGEDYGKSCVSSIQCVLLRKWVNGRVRIRFYRHR